MGLNIHSDEESSRTRRGKYGTTNALICTFDWILHYWKMPSLSGAVQTQCVCDDRLAPCTCNSIQISETAAAPCGVSRLFWRVSFSCYLFANKNLSHHVYGHSTPRRSIGTMDKKPHKISNRRFSPFCRLIQEKTHPTVIGEYTLYANNLSLFVYL